MAASINASTTAGVVTTADTSGVLNIQTANTTAISISASQVVSYTNNPTYSGGTANGVLYLNGSKVATSGSALVFDGTNLGLGVTPSAGYRASIKGNYSSIVGGIEFDNGGGDKTVIGFASATSPSFIISNQSAAGVLRFDTNNTERARIDSSGNLLVGTTSSTVWNGAAGTKFVVGGSGNTIASLQTSTTTVDQGAIFEGYATGISSNSAALGSIAFLRSNTSTTALTSYTAFYTNSAGTVAERVRIDAPGIRTVPTTNYDAANTGARFGCYSGGGAPVTYVQMPSGGIFDVWDSATNAKMRIDTSGNLLVGKAASSGTTVGAEIRPTGFVGSTQSGTTSSTSTLDVYSTGASAYRFFVGMNGTIYATNTTISAISDQRFKENIQDLDVGLSQIMALKPRKFDWKAGKGKDIKGDRGFIAQEFEQVFPDLIDEWKDPAPEGEEPYKSVRQDLIPVLVKAIQEQQNLINTMNARIDALEGAKQ